MTKIIFFLVVVLNGQPHQIMQQEMPNIDVCEEMAGDMISQLVGKQPVDQVQAGCITIWEPRKS
jgi:hypothetical protein